MTAAVGFRLIHRVVSIERTFRSARRVGQMSDLRTRFAVARRGGPEAGRRMHALRFRRERRRIHGIEERWPALRCSPLTVESASARTGGCVVQLAQASPMSFGPLAD